VRELKLVGVTCGARGAERAQGTGEGSPCKCSSGLGATISSGRAEECQGSSTLQSSTGFLRFLCLSLDLGVPQTQTDSKACYGRGVWCGVRARGLVCRGGHCW